MASLGWFATGAAIGAAVGVANSGRKLASPHETRAPAEKKCFSCFFQNFLPVLFGRLFGPQKIKSVHVPAS